jgi:hypothetical protein
MGTSVSPCLHVLVVRGAVGGGGKVGGGIVGGGIVGGGIVTVGAERGPSARGLHSSTISAQLERFVWDRGCA